MLVESLTDTEERELDMLISSRKWQLEQVDRLLGWEVLRVFSTGNWGAVMELEDFCDKIGINKNYPHVLVDRVRRKIEEQ
jgi:hypothetical protein